MAEPTLALAYADLRKEIGEYLGYSPTSSAWTSAQADEIGRILNSGCRRVYHALDPDTNQAYRWSFLYPQFVLPIVTSKYEYDLSDDFGGFWGRLTCRSSASHWLDIEITGEQQVREARMRNPNTTGLPRLAATRPAAYLPGGGQGQRQQVVLFPTPSESLTLEGRYFVLADALSATEKYPWGGAGMAECYRQAALAAAEAEREDMEGIHAKLFAEQLRICISADKFRMGPQLLGYNGDRSDDAGDAFRGHGSWSQNTYNGTAIGDL